MREIRYLGQSKIMVSPLGLGCWQFSSSSTLMGRYWKPLTQPTINLIVRTSIEKGINWFDTAELYGRGSSEKRLARALHEQKAPRESYVLATKWWPILRTANNIAANVEDRLRYLQTDYIDLYQVHNPYSFSSVEKEMEQLVTLLEAGKIKAIGVSNFSLTQMKRAHRFLQARGYFLAANQVKYSLLDRRIERNGVLEFAREERITLIAYSPLEQGLLTGRFHKNPDSIRSLSIFRRFRKQFKPRYLEKTQPIINLLEQLAEKYNARPEQIALSWLIQRHGDTVVAIPGASSAEHAIINAGAMNINLSEEDLESLSGLTAGI